MRNFLLMQLPRPSALRPLGADFDRFLYAHVGADGDGGVLTVISALARLGFDPWEQAAILARLPLDKAARALSALLAKLLAASGEPPDLMPLANQLVSLLPRESSRDMPASVLVARLPIGVIRSRWFGPLLFVVCVLLLLAARSLMEP